MSVLDDLQRSLEDLFRKLFKMMEEQRQQREMLEQEQRQQREMLEQVANTLHQAESVQQGARAILTIDAEVADLQAGARRVEAEIDRLQHEKNDLLRKTQDSPDRESIRNNLDKQIEHLKGLRNDISFAVKIADKTTELTPTEPIRSADRMRIEEQYRQSLLRGADPEQAEVVRSAQLYWRTPHIDKHTKGMYSIHADISRHVQSLDNQLLAVKTEEQQLQKRFGFNSLDDVAKRLQELKGLKLLDSDNRAEHTRCLEAKRAWEQLQIQRDVVESRQQSFRPLMVEAQAEWKRALDVRNLAITYQNQDMKRIKAQQRAPQPKSQQRKLIEQTYDHRINSAIPVEIAAALKAAELQAGQVFQNSTAIAHQLQVAERNIDLLEAQRDHLASWNERLNKAETLIGSHYAQHPDLANEAAMEKLEVALREHGYTTEYDVHRDRAELEELSSQFDLDTDLSEASESLEDFKNGLRAAERAEANGLDLIGPESPQQRDRDQERA